MKIPKDARKVFDGIMFDVYQWKQEQFDGSHEDYEMLWRPNTMDVIPVTPEGKIVVVEQEQAGYPPFIDIPGGRQQSGEKPITAAKRELEEETGMTSDDWQLLLKEDPSGKMDWTIYTYIAKGVKKTANTNLDAGEKIKTREVTFEEFLDIITRDDWRASGLALHILRLYKKDELDGLKKLLFS